MTDFKSLRERFNLETNIVSTVKPLKEVTNYKITNNDELISELEEELIEQQDYNTLLKDKNIEDNNKALKIFIDKNEEKINQQYDNIVKLSTSLMAVIEENNQLEENEKQYNEFLTSERAINISNKINKLKDIKKQYNFKIDIISQINILIFNYLIFLKKIDIKNHCFCINIFTS